MSTMSRGHVAYKFSLVSKLVLLFIAAAGIIGLYVFGSFHPAKADIITTTYTSGNSVILSSPLVTQKSTQVIVGTWSVCALKTDAQVYCAGYNGYGKLGDTTITDRRVPVRFQLPAAKSAAAVSTAYDHACVLTTDQLIYCSGRNDSGQLGDGTVIGKSTPVQFQLPAGKTAAAVSSADNSAVYDNTCALTTDQLVYCAGNNASGQLGDGSMTNRSTPVQFQLPAGKTAAAVSVSTNKICALTTDQLVYCAGVNEYGELGAGALVPLTPQSTPVKFQLPAGKTAVTVRVARLHVCVLTTDQLVYCGGSNGRGELGDGTANPTYTDPVQYQLPAGKTAAAFSGARYHVCVLTVDRLVYCAGYNLYGALGDGTTTDRSTPVQFQLPAGKTAVMLTTNSDNTCAITLDRLLYCSGYNGNGELGDGGASGSASSVPILYPLPGGKVPAAVDASFSSICALTTEQQIYCSGYNDNGQLGNNTLANQLTPALFQLP